MNKLERYVYDFVKTNPQLKRQVVETYQRLFSLLPTKPITTGHDVRVREGFFFGFHDKCPWSADEQKLLAHRIAPQFRGKMPQQGDSMVVGYFHGPTYEQFEQVAVTKAWNWQQGSMLQWLGDSNSLVFNDIENGQQICRIVSEDGAVRNLPKALGALSPDGRRGLSYSFERLGRGMPGYGYAEGERARANEPLPGSEGLSLIDIDTGQENLLFDVQAVAERGWHNSMEGAYHFFTHTLFNPSASRFVFFHRWLDVGGRLQTRMLSSDLSGENLHLFQTEGMVSHIAWQDDKHVLAYARTIQGDGYFLFEDQGEQVVQIGETSFSADGHPQYSNDSRYIVTDTYPNRRRVQKLIVYDTETNQRTDIAEVHSPYRFRQELRVDLHPRWNRSGTMICFDSSHTGQRSLCTVRFNSAAL